MKVLYCNVYYNPDTDEVGCEYSEVEEGVPTGCIFLEDAGCVQEAQRLLREERDYLVEQGRSKAAQGQC